MKKIVLLGASCLVTILAIPCYGFSFFGFGSGNSNINRAGDDIPTSADGIIKMLSNQAKNTPAISSGFEKIDRNGFKEYPLCGAYGSNRYSRNYGAKLPPSDYVIRNISESMLSYDGNVDITSPAVVKCYEIGDLNIDLPQLQDALGQLNLRYAKEAVAGKHKLNEQFVRSARIAAVLLPVHTNNRMINYKSDIEYLYLTGVYNGWTFPQKWQDKQFSDFLKFSTNHPNDEFVSEWRDKYQKCDCKVDPVTIPPMTKPIVAYNIDKLIDSVNEKNNQGDYRSLMNNKIKQTILNYEAAGYSIVEFHNGSSPPANAKDITNEMEQALGKKDNGGSAEKWQKEMISAMAFLRLVDDQTSLLTYNGALYSGKAIQVHEPLDSQGALLLPDAHGHYVGSEVLQYRFGLKIAREVNGYTVPNGGVLEEKTEILVPVNNRTASDMMREDMKSLYRDKVQDGFADSCTTITQKLVITDTSSSFACTNNKFSYSFTGTAVYNKSYIQETKIAR